MTPARLIHLELHTGEQPAASAFYADLLGWQTERIENCWGSYQSLRLGRSGMDGGIVQCATHAARWLPYVEVADIGAATDRARGLGATVLLEPREGPFGWRSVVTTRSAGEIAMWQEKR